MKYVLIFICSLAFIYLMTAFYNLTLNPGLWDVNSRFVFIIAGTGLSSLVTFILFSISVENSNEVIVRDPKTGRFKKK